MRAKIYFLPLHVPTPRHESELHDEQHEGHEVYTSSGHRCGVIPYSSVWWWIASWAKVEQYKGKNSLPRRGVLVLGELVGVRIENGTEPLLLWWLVLFIEALVLFPNIEREGIPQRPSLKGDN